jgi:enamine deaminase RidA (YjgF/YER057c/UK114 family)
MARGSDGNTDPRAHVPANSRWGGYEIRRQTEYLIREKFIPSLSAAGSSLANTVKAQVYLRDIDDAPHFLDVWNSHFGERQCALTIVPTKDFGLVPGIIEINLIALTDAAAGKKQVIDGCIPSAMTFGAAAVRAGDLLLCSGMLPVDNNGPIPGIRAGRGMPYYGVGPHAQMTHIVDAIKAVCKAGGTTIENVVRIHEFHADLTDFYPMHRAWQRALGDAPVPYTAVRVPKSFPVPACTVMVDAWVYAP